MAHSQIGKALGKSPFRLRVFFHLPKHVVCGESYTKYTSITNLDIFSLQKIVFLF